MDTGKQHKATQATQRISDAVPSDARGRFERRELRATRTCVGSDAQRRREATQSDAGDAEIATQGNQVGPKSDAERRDAWFTATQRDAGHSDTVPWGREDQCA